MVDLSRRAAASETLHARAAELLYEPLRRLRGFVARPEAFPGLWERPTGGVEVRRV